MAHKGRYFPVAFRRDFNFESDVRSITALADRYRITLQPGFAPLFDPLGLHFDCDQVAQPDPATLAWQSAAQSAVGHMWAARLRIAFNHLPDTILQATAELIRDGAIVVRWRWITESRDDPLYHGGLAGQTLLFVDIAVFPSGVDVYHSDASPIGYPP